MEFLPEQWDAKLGEPQPDAGGYYQGTWILGPSDALWGMKLREMIRDKINWGPAVPLDIFLLSLGESPTRKQTKIGGLPYWDRHQPWPCNSDGMAKPFFAQFDLSKSKDICETVPADVLLLFGHPEAAEGLSLVWQKELPPSSLIKPEEVPVQSLTPAYYGTRWRTTSYPKWEPKDEESWSDMELADGTAVANLFLVVEPLGVGIGSAQFLPPDSSLRSSDAKVLCCLPTISPNINIPYPFLNHADPIPEANLEQYQLNVSEVLDADSFGLLYIYRTAAGTFEWHLDGL